MLSILKKAVVVVIIASAMVGVYGKYQILKRKAEILHYSEICQISYKMGYTDHPSFDIIYMIEHTCFTNK